MQLLLYLRRRADVFFGAKNLNLNEKIIMGDTKKNFI